MQSRTITIHVCDICDTEIEGEFCKNHPNDSVSSIQVVQVRDDENDEWKFS